MSRLATSFVLGYHGCDKRVAEQAVNGDFEILHSRRDFDWLGPGAYFWESDPTRALEFAQWKAHRGEYAHPTVIGAVIDLRNCLDLVSREDLEVLKGAYKGFIALQKAGGLPIPKNRSAKGQPDADRILRYLDCAVIKHLHSVVDVQAEAGGVVEPYDTVRGMFTEGKKLYPGAGLRKKSHVQIAVRNGACIRGFFFPR